MIGIGLQGRGLLNQFLWRKVVVKTVCDCDHVRRDDRLRRVQEYYAEHADLGIPKDACRAESDFRKVIEDPRLTWFASQRPTTGTPTLLWRRMKHGKDVYCEKPLTYSVDEARTIVEVAKKNGTHPPGRRDANAPASNSARPANWCATVSSATSKYVENQFGGPACPRRPY
jgi:predicted dehydrogenase